MIRWFTSLKGAITLSVLALLTEMWRGFLDAMFVFPVDFSNRSVMILAGVIFTVLFAGWAWTLILAGRGSRAGQMAAFALNALVWLAIPASWLLFYCPGACRAEAGIFNLANSLNLVFGLLAGISFGVYLFGSRESRPANPLEAA